MFRSDRDALAEKVDSLQSDNTRLLAENEAMRRDLLAYHAASPRLGTHGGGVYKDGPIHEGERAALARHALTPFPVWKVVVPHILTLGVSSWIRFNTMHDRLPKAEHDDPSAAKAITFHVIPYFNMYWVFFNGLRLADRINLQLRLRDEAPRIDRSWVVTAGVASVLPYVNFILAPIAWLVVAIQMQRAINRIVEIDRGEGEASNDTRVHVPVLESVGAARLDAPWRNETPVLVEPATAAATATAYALEAGATEEVHATEAEDGMPATRQHVA